MAGEYTSESKNYKKGSMIIPKSDVNYHDDRRPIIDGKSFMSLRDMNEMIIFYMGKYYRFKKFRYFEDKYLKPIYDDIHKNEDKKELLEVDG